MQHDERLIFEKSEGHICGVDFEDFPEDKMTFMLGDMKPREEIKLPNLSEPTVIRHFTRLSQLNYAIDLGLYPLGSCTMKYNPRLNEKVTRLPGFSALHPLQPDSTTQGALKLIYDLKEILKELTGMADVAMSPAAGAHGELCGLMMIKQALEYLGQKRRYVLVPESAHGTNPATAASCGFEVLSIKGTDQGLLDYEDFLLKIKQYDHEIAAIMLTNPNTCGLFEKDIVKIAQEIHKIGGYFYCDGANFNAIMGHVRPGDLGIDCMHLNLHKTFSTPHGGGGPGAGPVVVSDKLAPFIPLPYVIKKEDGLYELVQHSNQKVQPNSILNQESFGTSNRHAELVSASHEIPKQVRDNIRESEFTVTQRLRSFHGQMGMFIRAYAYILSLGQNGIRQAALDAVTNANYVRVKCQDFMTSSFEGICMHEALFDDQAFESFGLTTMDIAKGLIDAGFHPMTIYFPLVVHGAMLIEPTETESKYTLDQFIKALRHIVTHAKTEKDGAEFYKKAPYSTPRRRLDETLAARSPNLRYPQK